MDNPISFLAWDSSFFARRVGRLTIQTNTALDELLSLADQQNYELLYVYSPMALPEAVVGSYSLLDVGGHIRFAHDLSTYQSETSQYRQEIVEYNSEFHTPELIEVACLSGHLSRFRIDPKLPVGSFERLYETWLTNSFKNRPRTGVYTYLSNGRVAGMISTKLHDSKCTIELLGVLQSCQGRGIGSQLINHVREICITNRVGSIEVKTQLTNTSARRLYCKNSFAEQDRSFLYHAHRYG